MSLTTTEINAANFATMRHIERVRDLLNWVVIDLLRRGEAHDQTKLNEPEAELFALHTPALKSLTFNSPEYKEELKKLDVALQHHYARNPHHPEHFPEGVNDMTLLDLIEMLVDWKASSERMHNGNILKSIETNSGRYNISPQLTRIFENTVRKLEQA